MHPNPHLNSAVGVGLRYPHFQKFTTNQVEGVDVVELLTEQYLADRGLAMSTARAIKDRYPLLMHGVSLNIGSDDDLDLGYLKKAKELADELDVSLVSDHFCWTGLSGRNSHDLLPLVYSPKLLQRIVDRSNLLCDYFGRPFALENPSSYLQFTGDVMYEWEFIHEYCQKSSGGILLDVNNIFVSAYNHQFEPQTFIDAIPAGKVFQYHLAGHTNKNTHIIDTHLGPVPDVVWDVFRSALKCLGAAPSIIEWDEAVPSLGILVGEVQKARAIINDKIENDSGNPSRLIPLDVESKPRERHSGDELLQSSFLDTITLKAPPVESSSTTYAAIRHGRMTKDQHLDIYRETYFVRTSESLAEDFPALVRLLEVTHLDPDDFFAEYIQKHPSRSFSLHFLDNDLIDHCQEVFGEASFEHQLCRLEHVLHSLSIAPNSQTPFEQGGKSLPLIELDTTLKLDEFARVYPVTLGVYNWWNDHSEEEPNQGFLNSCRKNAAETTLLLSRKNFKPNVLELPPIWRKLFGALCDHKSLQRVIENWEEPLTEDELFGFSRDVVAGSGAFTSVFE